MSKADNINKVIKNSVANMVRRDIITGGQYDKLISIHSEFTIGSAYIKDEIVRYNGNIYEVIQGHTSQSDWTPDSTPSLFKKVVPRGVIPNWSQPTGAHDAYSLGYIVLHQNKIWESTVDGNTWKPSVYGWVEA